MKKNIKTTGWLLTTALIFLASSCNKKNDNVPLRDNVLIGTWVDTAAALPSGYYVNELIFEPNNSFTEKSNAYNTYNEPNKDILSGWYVRTGNYELDENKISFSAKKVVSWDSFWETDAKTTIDTHQIFEGCTFVIKDNILELNYVTYPADAPEKTTRQYKKLKSSTP